MDTIDNWRSLYKIGGWVALILLAYSLVTMVVMFVLGTPPTTAMETFKMLEENKFAGLLRLDLLTVLVCMPLYYLLFLGLYVALKRTCPVPAAIVMLFGCAGVTLFLATPSVFSWLTLGDKFVAVTSDAQKNLLLAAGESLLVSDMWHGTGATIGGILIQFSTTMVSIVMLSSSAFKKSTAYVGVTTHGLDLARLLLSFFIPSISVGLMAIAGTLYLIWFPLLALDFFKLGRNE